MDLSESSCSLMSVALVPSRTFSRVFSALRRLFSAMRTLTSFAGKLLITATTSPRLTFWPSRTRSSRITAPPGGSLDSTTVPAGASL